MTSNNRIDRNSPIDILLVAFPLAASSFEFGEAMLETISASYVRGTTIHIPMAYLSLVAGLTIFQYALAWAIAATSKNRWSKHSINAILEVVLLLYCLVD